MSKKNVHKYTSAQVHFDRYMKPIRKESKLFLLVKILFTSNANRHSMYFVLYLILQRTMFYHVFSSLTYIQANNLAQVLEHTMKLTPENLVQMPKSHAPSLSQSTSNQSKSIEKEVKSKQDVKPKQEKETKDCVKCPLCGK